MGVCILKVGGRADVAQALAQAPSASGWRFTHVPSLAAARTALAQQRFDLLLVHHALPDGTAWDLDPALCPAPTVLTLEPGQEALAAPALDAHFVGCALEVNSPGHEALLCAQIRAALRHRDTSLHLQRRVHLLDAIQRAQSSFIRTTDHRGAFQVLLDDLIGLTGSAFGLVGEVIYDSPEQPWLRVRAITDLSWDAASQQAHANAGRQGMAFRDLGSLFGAVMVCGEPVLCADASTDPRAGGVPRGHPVLKGFLGLPVGPAGALQAVVALANRPGGYSADDVSFLQPLLDTIGQLIQARQLVQQQATAVQTLHTTLDSISQGLTLTDASGCIALFNQRALDLLDLPREVMALRPRQADIIAWQRNRGDFGDDMELVVDEQAQLHLGGDADVANLPDKYQRRTRRGLVLEVRRRVLPDGGVVRTFTDVTEYVHSQEALQAASMLLQQRSELLETTLSAMGQGLLVVGGNGRVKAFNPQFCRLLDLPEPLLARLPTMADVVAFQAKRGDFGEAYGMVDEQARGYVAAGGVLVDHNVPRVYVRRTHHGRLLEVKSEPLPNGGYVRTVTDVTRYAEATERARESTAEVMRLNTTLEQRVAQRTAELERSMHDMEVLSFSIAHDLRGPLRAINGFATLIAADEADRLSPDGQALLGRITEASRRMGAMITDLLELFKVARTELQPVAVDLATLVQEAVRSLASASGAHAAVGVEPMPKALGDPTMLRHLVFNLVDNALKYSSRQAQPVITVGWDAGQAAWFVRDNGVGFDMAHADQLFGLFQRLDVSHGFDGTGVGLAVVERIAERHGGRVWAESSPGQGATFWFVLPQG